MQEAVETQARQPRKVSRRAVRRPKARNCIEESTFDPEHDIAIGGDHGKPVSK